MKFAYHVSLILILFCSWNISCSENSAQPQVTNNEPIVWPNAFEMNDRIGRAINLGNALDAPIEGEWGVTLEESFFSLIDSVGFDAVRIPIRWPAHAALDSPYTIDPRFLQRVDWAVESALERGLVAIINIHHYEEIMQHPEEHKSRFLGLWRQLAAHYQDDSPNLIFEVLNEPNAELTPTLWNEYLTEALSIIRETNPRRAVIVGTANWGGISSLSNLVIPEADSMIIVTYHYYNPFQFTHQGAGWVDGSNAWLGTTWSETEAEKQAVRNDFDLAENWAKQHNRPIFMGEFGAYSAAGLVSRVRWTNFVAREAERRGFSWAYWEFCSGFGIYDADAGDWNGYLLQALIPD
ncbi:MAG: Endoglucanase H [Candidatus Marinimicrobia bacterium]|nr:Endoglucanase H [Candidatus Neomarinimicrobiota bacterium]